MKIIDAFILYNELDLLEIRLNILGDIVDEFILVEATKTFQNQSKPLYYEDNKDRYEQYHSRIRHIVVDDLPDSKDPFDLEAHQRNAILRGLDGYDDNDQILVSDVDEIPDPDAVILASRMDGLKAFRQQLYYYYINCACIELNDLPWSVMCRKGELETPQKLRDRLVEIQGQLLSGIYTDRNDIHIINNAGWHFSYMGGLEAIRDKIKSFSHAEFNEPEYLSDENLTAAINKGIDLFGREYHFEFVPLDKNYPQYILNNIERYRHLVSTNG